MKASTTRHTEPMVGNYYRQTCICQRFFTNVYVCYSEAFFKRIAAYQLKKAGVGVNIHQDA
jgi:hypothetical protein